MTVDTRGIRPEHVGKHLHVKLATGEALDIALLELTVCETPEPCCGITYDLISTNSPAGLKQPGGTYWTGFSEITNFEVRGD